MVSQLLVAGRWLASLSSLLAAQFPVVANPPHCEADSCLLCVFFFCYMKEGCAISFSTILSIFQLDLFHLLPHNIRAAQLFEINTATQNDASE